MSERIAEARRWFQQSGYDLQAVEWNIEGKFYDTACFLAQQAAEKAMPEKKLKEFLSIENEARELDLHYVPSRYPNGLPGGFPHQFYDVKMAESALAAARKIFSLVHAFYQEKQEAEILQQ